MFSLVPMPHQVEAVKKGNMLRLRGGGNQRHHGTCVSLGDDLGRVLRIDQHDVGAGRLEARQSLAQQRGVRLHGFAVQH